MQEFNKSVILEL